MILSNIYTYFTAHLNGVPYTREIVTIFKRHKILYRIYYELFIAFLFFFIFLSLRSVMATMKKNIKPFIETGFLKAQNRGTSFVIDNENINGGT